MDKFEEKTSEINEYFKDYLKFKGYDNTLLCFKAEIKSQKVNSKLQKNQDKPEQVSKYEPKIFSMMKGINERNH